MNTKDPPMTDHLAPRLTKDAASDETTWTDEDSDEQLMEAIQRRDERALKALLHRYRTLLHSTASNVVSCPCAAHEIVQECWLEVWSNAGLYQPHKGSPLAWIITIVRRRAIDHTRRLVAYKRAKDAMQNDTQAVCTADADAGRYCEIADLGGMLRKHLPRLPEAQREAVCLAFMQGMSQREVAKTTRVPLGTVKTRLELGMRKLRNAFRLEGAHGELQRA